MRVLVLLGLAACGRIGFGGEDLPDATDAATAQPCPRSATVPPVVHIRGTTFRYLSFDNTRQPLGNSTITAYDDVGQPSLGSTTSIGDGTYDLALTTAGVPLPVVILRYARGGEFTTQVHFDLPVASDVMGPNGDVLELGDGPLWNSTGMNAIYMTAGLTYDASRGFLGVAVRDCAGAPIAGATVDVQPPPEAIVYQGDNGMPTMGRIETQPRFGQAYAMNVLAGTSTITITHPTLTFAPITVEVETGTFNQQLVARTLQ